MHTHHSHSGQFCQHAKDQLEDVVLAAIEAKFELVCLTEHAPRLQSGLLYPEELESNTTIKDLFDTFDNYYKEAQRLKAKYGHKIKIFVGFEGEGLDKQHIELARDLLSKYRFDMFIGSLHHVGDVPIDFDRETFDLAVQTAGGLEQLFSQYFDQQYELITELKPPVLGHFDLVRLWMPEYQFRNTPVWSKICRNVKAAVEAGCLFEINTSAIRKGWPTPYPQPEIMEVIKAEGGSCCLSDDSHGISQVGLNYHKVAQHVQLLGKPLQAVDGTELTSERYKLWQDRKLNL